MAAWFTVYCSRPASRITAAKLLAAVRASDLHTVAEGFGIEDDDVVDEALSLLRIEPADEPKGVKFRILYRPPEFRPVLFHLWDDPGRVRTERAEAEELLEGVEGKGVDRVRAHLRGMVEVVALELGWGQLEDMGVVIAGQIAEYVASVAKGVIRDPNDEWWAMKGQVPVRLVGGSEKG